MRSTDERPIVVDGRMIHQEQCHGIARVTIEFIRHLPVSHTREIVLLLAAGRQQERFDLRDLERRVTVETCTSAIGRPWETRDLNRTLRRLDAGVFYAPYHALAPLHVPCPLVIGLHDTIIESDRRLSGSTARALAYRANTLRALAQAHAVVVPSLATAASLPAHYSHVPPVEICPNGVDPAFSRSSATALTDARYRYALPDRYVLHVGARRPHKNQSVLVRALSSVSKDVGLVLLGQPDPRTADPIGELARECGVSDRVIAIDSVDDTELAALYFGANVFAFPSLAEGFGLPPLEAMAAGVPVIASAIPVVAEVCEDAAMLVSPFSPKQWADAIHDVLRCPSLRDRLIQDGFKIAAGAGWTAGAAKLFTLLDDVAGGRR